MSVYLGNNLLAGTPDVSGKANTSLNNLDATGQAVIDGKANIALDNLTADGKNIGNWSSNVTNCITYIPQDIKLELNAGTLTLKAGSKVYVPNGFEQDGTTPKFDEVTIESDVQCTASYSDTRLFFYNPNFGLFGQINSECFSGTSAPSGLPYMEWYDTTNNILKSTTNSGSTWINGTSFPLCIATGSSGSMVSIDQVFNGFGYIGSTVFALPGVKGLIPNGRNDDGTLKSIEYTNQNVATSTLDSGINNIRTFILRSDGSIRRSDYFYVSNDNYLFQNDTGQIWSAFIFATCPKIISGKIEIFVPKTVFHSLDWNDKGTIAGWSMPSSKKIELTLGATNTTYTAPANGFFLLQKGWSSGQTVGMTNNSTGFTTTIAFSTGAADGRTWMFARKGDVVRVFYTASGTLYQFNFYYAEGEVE